MSHAFCSKPLFPFLCEYLTVMFCGARLCDSSPLRFVLHSFCSRQSVLHIPYILRKFLLTHSIIMDNPSSTKFQNSPMVTLNVGPDRHTFHVHPELLFKVSPVFKAAFSGAYQESSERCMALPDEEPETVERLTQWLYSRSFSLTDDVSFESADERYWQLARLNTLADKFDIGLLKNSIIDELFATRRTPEVWPPQPPVIAYIYENTTETSSLRKLMVGWYVWQIDPAWYTSSDTPAILEHIPMFAADVAIAMSRKAEDPNLKNPFCSKPSTYYEDGSKSSED